MNPTTCGKNTLDVWLSYPINPLGAAVILRHPQQLLHNQHYYSEVKVSSIA